MSALHGNVDVIAVRDIVARWRRIRRVVDISRMQRSGPKARWHGEFRTVAVVMS